MKLVNIAIDEYAEKRKKKGHVSNVSIPLCMSQLFFSTHGAIDPFQHWLRNYYETNLGMHKLNTILEWNIKGLKVTAPFF